MHRTFIVADTHFSHHNIIQYENRPFSNAEEMNQYMIDQWNQTVSENDYVFHLGDVIIDRAKQAQDILKQLNGRKILIRGNHDKFTKTKWLKMGFLAYDYYIYDDYLLTHMPADETPLKTAMNYRLLKGNIHGHVHTQIDHLDQSLYKCASIEWLDYKPVLFDDFIKKT